MRRLVVVVAGVLGLAVGALGALAAQDSGSDPGPQGTASATTAPSPAAVAPVLPPSPKVLLAWTPSALDPAMEPTARAFPGVQAVSVVRSEVVDLVASWDGEGRPIDQFAAGWVVPLDAVAIDPAAHAALVPVADRETVAGLADGSVLLGRTSAQLRRLGPFGVLELTGGVRLTVSGIVDDTTIGGAEMAVTVGTGTAIGVDTPRYLLAAHDADRAALEATLRASLPADAPMRFRGPGETPFLRHGDAVLPPVRIKERFGEFAYQPPADGQDEFVQDPGWQNENLVERDLPLVGRVRCHKAIVDAFEGALQELEASGLGGLVEPAGFAGCWNSRTVRRGDAISHHAWGVAFDLNYGTNPTGLESIQDPRLVEVLARWGFTWGGDWLVPDPAHFEIR